MSFLKPDGTSFHFYTEIFLGTGSYSIVLRSGPYALKIPKVRPVAAMSGRDREYLECDNEDSRAMLEAEKAVYLRVGRCDGIAECINISHDGILLALYQHGDLQSYVESKPDVDRSRKAQWMLSIIKTLRHFHDAKVLLDDLALRNILVADDLSFKLIDFGQCALFPLDVDINVVNDHGTTAQADIFHLGCLIYSIASWGRYECDLFRCNWVRPPLSDLPELENLFCADIIRNCWSAGYSSMEQLYQQTHERLEHVVQNVPRRPDNAVGESRDKQPGMPEQVGVRVLSAVA
ncbi:MAG: hypothetical protein Q9168_004121 [Polycauliona sp. 1 TL-2023]